MKICLFLSLTLFSPAAVVDAFSAINVVPANGGSMKLDELAKIARSLRPLAFDPATPEYDWAATANASKQASPKLKIQPTTAQLPLNDDEEIPSPLLQLAEFPASCDDTECRERLVAIVAEEEQPSNESEDAKKKEKKIFPGDVLVSVSAGTCMEVTSGFDKYDAAEAIRRCVACARKKGANKLDVELNRVVLADA